MEQSEGDGDEYAEAASGDTSNSEKVVFTPQPAASRQYDFFLPSKTIRVIVVDEPQFHQVTGVKVNFYPSVQFPEARQRAEPHPHHQIFLLAQLGRQRVKVNACLHPSNSVDSLLTGRFGSRLAPPVSDPFWKLNG